MLKLIKEEGENIGQATLEYVCIILIVALVTLGMVYPIWDHINKRSWDPKLRKGAETMYPITRDRIERYENWALGQLE